MTNSKSKLAPFHQLIATERRRGTPYRKLAAILAEKGLSVDASSIFDYVKVRSKPPRKVFVMLEQDAPPANIPTTEPPSSSSAAPGVEAQLAAIQRLRQAGQAKRKSAKGLSSFQSDAPLERVSEQEARRLRPKPSQ